MIYSGWGCFKTHSCIAFRGVQDIDAVNF
jgi:hypothetical protein